MLENLGLDVKVVSADVEEKVEGSPPPPLMVQELALMKGAAAARTLRSGLVLSADTLVFSETEALGKPRDAAHAKEMLRRLSGKTHLVYTGICVIDAGTGKSATDFSVTEVVFRPLEEREIDRYIQSGEPFDKAGGYGIQGLGSLLVEKIQGDYFNVVGLPLVTLNRLLKAEFDTNIL